MKKDNEELFNIARRKTENVKGCFLSLYLQEIETRIIDTVVKFLMTTPVLTYNGQKVLTYEFDGLKLLKENVEKYGNL